LPAVAVTPATLKATVKPPATALDDVTVKVMAVVPLLPSVTVGLLMVTVLVSSFVMVPVPTAPVVMLSADTGGTGVTVPSVSVNASFPSTVVSPLTLTVMVCVSPAVPVKDNGLLVTTAKSLPRVAVPLAALKATVKPPCTAADDVTVNCMVVVPALPSMTVGLLMVSVLVSSLVMVPVPTAPVVMLAAWTGVVAPTVPRVAVSVSLP